MDYRAALIEQFWRYQNERFPNVESIQMQPWAPGCGYQFSIPNTLIATSLSTLPITH